MKNILLITEQYDPTADNLILELRRRGLACVRWNLDCYPCDSVLTYYTESNDLDGSIETDGRVIPFKDISSVWSRTYRARGFPSNLEGEKRIFIERETEMALDSLSLVTDWFWINDPRYQRQAVWKPAQLHLAKRLGFNIPMTKITNDPNSIRQFWNQHNGKIIYKALSQYTKFEPGKAVFTGIVTPEALSSVDLIKNTPGIFQELIPKAYEVRATVVGDHIAAVKIMSQESERTRIDWRISPQDLKFVPIDLPTEIQHKIRTFLAESKLIYSCLDFIVTPEGQYVFLESNPGGQYLWIEDATKLPITAMIADALSTNTKTHR